VSQFIQTGLWYWMQSTGIERFELGLLHGCYEARWSSRRQKPAQQRRDTRSSVMTRGRRDAPIFPFGMEPLNAAFRTGPELRRTMVPHRLKLSTFL